MYTRERRERADGEHVAVGKFDDVKHAEEKRESNRHQRIHHAEHQPIHDVLSEQARVHIR